MPSRLPRLAIRAAVSASLLAAAAFVVVEHASAPAVIDAFARLSGEIALLALAALAVAATLAAARVKMVAQDFGYRLPWRTALAALGLGQLGGALFFQIGGQLAARGIYLSRRGFPVSATVLTVGYERLLALVVSMALAASGAWYIFGQIAVDMRGGGDELVKLTIGIFLAVTAGACFGWGRMAAANGAFLLGKNPLRRVLRGALLSLAIQLATASAYVVLAHALAPEVPYLTLAAASFVVMFAASLPISLAGWGVRELSAAVVLGAVGVPTADALVAAAVVGVGSLLVVLPLSVLALAGGGSGAVAPPPSEARIDYSRLVSFLVPLAAATAVFFNVHLPTEAGGLNINLADPLVLIGAALLLIAVIVHHRSWPQWRMSGTNLHIVLATIVMTSALLIGAARVGWTEWALANKYYGWFVLLAYAATGALMAVAATGRDSRLFLMTLMAAGLAVAGLELSLEAVRNAGFELSARVLHVDATGFASNRNAFAYQMLMVVAVTIALGLRRNLTMIGLGIALAALWFAGSRAGWIAVAAILVMAVWVEALTWRGVARALLCAIGIVVCINLVWVVSSLPQYYDALVRGGVSNAAGDLAREFGARAGVSLYEESTTTERLRSLRGGLALFLEHPLFGAGLGSYMESELRTTGVPLVIHSTPLWIAAEMGLIGLLIFAVPVVRIFRHEIGRCLNDPAARLLVLIITGFSIMSLVHEMFYQRVFWLLLGAGLAWTASSARSEAGRVGEECGGVLNGSSADDAAPSRALALATFCRRFGLGVDRIVARAFCGDGSSPARPGQPKQ